MGVADSFGMEITLNGEKHLLVEPLSVVDLLRSLGVDPEKVAVEIFKSQKHQKQI